MNQLSPKLDACSACAVFKEIPSPMCRGNLPLNVHLIAFQSDANFSSYLVKALNDANLPFEESVDKNGYEVAMGINLLPCS